MPGRVPTPPSGRWVQKQQVEAQSSTEYSCVVEKIWSTALGLLPYFIGAPVADLWGTTPACLAPHYHRGSSSGLSCLSTVHSHCRYCIGYVVQSSVLESCVVHAMPSQSWYSV